MWSDGRRPLKIAALLAALLILGAIHAWVSMAVVFGYRDCVEAAQAADGARLVFPLWEVTRIDGPDRYAASKVLKDVPIVGDTADLRVGMTVSIEGTFRAADLAVVERRREIHHLRPWKEGLGLLGFAAAVALAPRFFGWRAGRVREWLT